MKNTFEVRGDVTVIFLNRRDGLVIETLIDTNDLLIAQEFNGTWYAHWARNTKSFYVMGNLRVSKDKRTSIMLHRWLMNPTEEKVVDHQNHDTLDNRKHNLRVVTNLENNHNINPNKFPVRGVYWSKDHQKWRANATVKGRKYHLGLFEKLEDAKRVVSEWRNAHMPHSTMDRKEGEADAVSR